MDIHVVEGGVGRHIFFSALIPKLAEKEKIIVMSSYPDIFESNPHVYRSLGRNTQYAWSDFVMKPENRVIFFDPYFTNEFIKKETHVIESYAKGLGIEYSDDMLPQLFIPQNFKKDAERFKADHKDFIIVQFSSGQSPYAVDERAPFMWNGFARDYPREKAQELINLIHEEYPGLKILNFSFINEATYGLKHTFSIKAPYLFYAALLEQSKGFIGINSCLTHMAAAMGTPGVVLWGATGPEQWGYKTHINVATKCDSGDNFCSRPYLRDLGDFIGSGAKWSCSSQSCMNHDPQKVLNKLIDVIGYMPKTIEKDHQCQCKAG